jgi:ligand-binding sensor domain-containing protein/signal transduction histidine kinase
MLDCLVCCSSGHRAVGLAILLGVPLFAAQPAMRAQNSATSSDWVVDTWQTDGGLPQNSVTCIAQTRDGYLWVGTANGLARFDGVRFTTFRVGDSLGLRSNRILCLYEDTGGALWVGTEGGGLARYERGQFTSLTSADGLASDTVLCLGEDQAGALWVGTDSGLNRRQGGNLTTFYKTDGLPDDRVNAICQPGGEPLLFATEKGLSLFNRDLLATVQTAWPAAAYRQVRFLRTDREGSLWMGGDAGLFQSRAGGAPASDQTLQVWQQAVLSFIERSAGEIWFGTSQGEILRLASRGNSVVPERVWEVQLPVTALCEDREGNLWIGTAGDGLHRLKHRQLRLLPLPELPAANWPPCFFETPKGELRFLAGTKELYRHTADGFALLEPLPLPNGVMVQTVQPTFAGELWIGTLRDGLFQWADGVLRQFSERDGLSDSAIEVLRAEEDGGVWLGTRNGGLNHFKDRVVTRFNTPWGFYGNYACALERDAQGQLWIGTTGDGLFQLKEGRFTAYTEAAGLLSAQIRTLHADPDDSLWVGTARGLCRVKSGRVTAFAAESGVPQEAVLQLRSDGEGNLWVGSANRIYRATKQQLAAYAEGRTRHVTVVQYGREDGLPGIQCLPQIQSRNWPEGAGGVWFATTRGMVVVDRGGQPWNQLPPPVVLENVLVENVDVPFDDGVRVAPGKDSLRFEYTALSLSAPGKVSFRYQLENFDRDWSEASVSRAARYPKVPPGDYVFRVVACNNDGVWNETGASVAITVMPFWWETVWFRLAVIAAVAVIFVSLYRSRQARRRELERLRVRIAGDLHDDIGSSLWSITLLSRMLAKHGKVGAEERQDLEEIHRIANQTANSIRDIIWLINPAFDTVQDLVLRTKDFAATLLRGVEYRLQCEGTVLTRKLPFDFRQNLFLFFKEALTNVARHAHATAVDVQIEESGKQWRLTIQDNGAGFDPAKAPSGNGLRNLRARAAKMGAELEIRSQPGQGTALVLTTNLP